MRQRIILLIVLITMFVWSLKAQQIYQPGKVIPPSPTAASLGRFGENPVSYYTGLPSIAIPLYNITLNDFSLPVSLAYSSSGIKANEEAGWVGLGWALSAGGVITRNVRGFDDFANFGYFRAGALPPNTPGNDYQVTSNWPTEKVYLNDVFSGRVDPDPDLFNFNFAGFAGKFVLGKKADGPVVYEDQSSTLKIEFLESAGWLITDGTGNKYYFNRGESTTDYTYNSTSAPAPVSAPWTDFNASQPITNSWYLDSIVTSSKKLIRFVYGVRGDIVSPMNWSEKEYNQLYISGGCFYGPAGVYKTFYSGKQVVHESYLQQIIFPGGTVNFTTTDRTDLEYLNTIKPGKLSDISIKDPAGNQIQGFTFYHSYFTGDGNTRLKLDSVAEYGSSTAYKKPPHKFTYFSPDQLPSKVTKQVDYWGYFNGNGFLSLLPAVNVRAAGLAFAGADRNPDTTIANIQKGVLSTVTYPAGGITEYEYEMNTYSNLIGDDRYYITPMSLYAESGDNVNWTWGRDTFVIVNDTPVVAIRFSYSKTDPNGPDLINPNLQVVYANLYKGTQLVASYSNFLDRNDDQQVLLPGTYIIEARYVQGYSTRMWANYDQRVKTNIKLAGGLRIKSIRNKVDGKYYDVKKYQYMMNDTLSSGRMMNKPVPYYFFEFSSNVNPSTGVGSSCTYTARYLARESGTAYPPGLNTVGNIIGYDKVTETIGENGEGGKNEFYFNNSEGTPVYPNLPPIMGNWNGRLSKAISYSVDGKKVTQKESEYSNMDTRMLKGLKLYGYDELVKSNASFEQPAFTIKFYNNQTLYTYLSKETTTTYSGTDSLVNVKTFAYENAAHKQMTMSVEKNSEGKIVTKKFKYPGDYTSASASSFVKQMVARNIITPVIEEQTIVAGTSGKRLVHGAFIEYALFNDAYNPKTIYQLRTDVPSTDTTVSTITSTGALSLHPGYKAETFFDSYDVTGNITQTHTSGGDSTSYLWDYNLLVPVAKAGNTGSRAIAFTSFEGTEKGNWTYAGTITTDATTITGRKCYSISGNAISRSGLDASTSYIVSYWTKNGAPFAISGTASGYPLKGQTVNQWTYYQHKITGVTAVSIAGSGYIDEVRLYPVGATLYTYTYDPLLGVTSECNENNRVMYYLYDNLGRLKVIKNLEGKIIKQLDYQYQVSTTR